MPKCFVIEDESHAEQIVEYASLDDAGQPSRIGLIQALDVQDNNPLLAKLEAELSDTTDVYVNYDVDAKSYFAGLTDSIRHNVCKPFPVSDTVMAPGFPDIALGQVISGQCVAHQAGYWLVYQPEQNLFYCFWGESASNLGAHGVFGSPLHYWSA
ncbi:hypothetical protein FHT12_002208 [Xanthomonas campestris]|uniref:hypothetical protein n=1 Tax=Xanthomonas euroxanthea TaxID=2259622 RepID=UPI000CEEED43|nr:hypothetical protein [Xanthomonas euroxanthea]NIJ93511.1 hypothetical protein [Xanthomonas euroxanthea]PPT30702.1 hypothetical protein XaCFBP7622_12265 [Xanthomonas arboricola]